MSRFSVGCLLAVLVCAPVSVVGQSASAEPAPTIRSTSELVVVDVVATDAHENPVHRLAASAFTILEDGHPQTIKAFEEHVTGTPAPLPPLPKLPPGRFTNYSAAPASGALNILLLDKLNTSMNAQALVRDQVLKYLKKAPAGTRIAIFGLTTQLRLLQGFTSDPDLLRALVEGKRALPGSSPLMNNSVSGDTPGSDNLALETLEGANSDVLGNTPGPSTVLANLQQFEAGERSFQLMLRVRYTLDAFNQLAHYLSSLPGRKNLIWFSGSFPISILPDRDLQDPFSTVASSEDEFRETVDMLSRSRVAVYPIDARELMADPMMNASSSGRSYARNPAAAEENFFKQTANEHSTMTQMAEATGGKAFFNTNDLAAAVGQAVEDGSDYYTLAYRPTNQKEDGSYRKIEVTVDQPGVKLAYRRGYFADMPASAKRHHETQDAKSGAPPYSAMRTAMLHGAPDPDDIIFVAAVRPSSMDTETKPASGNQIEPHVSGPYRRYSVSFVASPTDLSCPVTPDGKYCCEIEFLTYVYDADGALINSQMNAFDASFPPERYAAFLKSALVYRQQISVPVKGDYYLRLGLHDASADHVGALELPVSAVAKLPPVSAQTLPPGSAAAPKTAPK